MRVILCGTTAQCLLVSEGRFKVRNNMRNHRVAALNFDHAFGTLNGFVTVLVNRGYVNSVWMSLNTGYLLMTTCENLMFLIAHCKALYASSKAYFIRRSAHVQNITLLNLKPERPGCED